MARALDGVVIFTLGYSNARSGLQHRTRTISDRTDSDSILPGGLLGL